MTTYNKNTDVASLISAIKEIVGEYNRNREVPQTAMLADLGNCYSVYSDEQWKDANEINWAEASVKLVSEVERIVNDYDPIIYLEFSLVEEWNNFATLTKETNAKENFIWSGPGWYGTSVEGDVSITRSFSPYSFGYNPHRAGREAGLGLIRYYEEKPE